MASKTVTVTNLARDTKDLGHWTAKGRAKPGEGVHILLGSKDDLGVVGTPQPSVVVDRDVFAAALRGSKAVRGWVESQAIQVFEGSREGLSLGSLLSPAGA